MGSVGAFKPVLDELGLAAAQFAQHGVHALLRCFIHSAAIARVVLGRSVLAGAISWLVVGGAIGAAGQRASGAAHTGSGRAGGAAAPSCCILAGRRRHAAVRLLPPLCPLPQPPFHPTNCTELHHGGSLLVVVAAIGVVVAIAPALGGAAAQVDPVVALRKQAAGCDL